MAEDEKVQPGHFESSLEDYQGYFELPHPFLERHMKAWWEVAITPLKNLTQLDYEFYDGEYRGAVKLIAQHGKWAVDALPVGDLDTDSVPSEVKAWIMQEASAYIYPFLPPSIRLKMSGIM
jgi:hypothetical protein